MGQKWKGKKSEFKMWQSSYSRNDYNSPAEEQTVGGYREGNYDYVTVNIEK